MLGCSALRISIERAVIALATGVDNLDRMVTLLVYTLRAIPICKIKGLTVFTPSARE